MSPVLAAVTVGQAPRPDFAELARWLPQGVGLTQVGALDEAGPDELVRLAPEPDETDVIVSRLRDGRPVAMAQSRLLPLLQRAVDRAAAGADVVLLGCTGEFPTVSCSRPLVHPDRVVDLLLPVLVPPGALLGVIFPLPEQRELVAAKYASARFTVDYAAASPYVPDAPHRAVAAARQLAAKGADHLVLDCIGYTDEVARAVREATGLAAVLPRRLAAHIASEMLA